MHICRVLTHATGGMRVLWGLIYFFGGKYLFNFCKITKFVLSGTFAVVASPAHYQDLLWSHLQPPTIEKLKDNPKARQPRHWILMAFPNRTTDTHPSFCSWYFEEGGVVH